MRYKIILPRKVQKDLACLGESEMTKIIKALKSLEEDPFLGKKLTGKLKDKRSYRVWPFRIVYRIIKRDLVVLVIRIGQREGVYK